MTTPAAESSVFLRALRHAWTRLRPSSRELSSTLRQELEREIAASEARHAGEVVFAVETALTLPQLYARLSPRQRAMEVFAALGVWDTAGNNGVLIYVLLADRSVEIVADRAIALKVTEYEWAQVCGDLQLAFREGRYRQGALAAIQAASGLLARHWPAAGGDGNELPNQPVLL